MKGRLQAPFFMSTPLKIPQSVLVVIYTPALDVLLIKRADSPDFWQSVTGSKDTLEETFAQTAVREVWEETGIRCAEPTQNGQPVPETPQLQDWALENVYEIYPRWRHRYPAGVSHNREHLFGLQVPPGTRVQLSPREHTQFQWLPCPQAAQACYSPSNAEAILMLPRFLTSKAKP